MNIILQPWHGIVLFSAERVNRQQQDAIHHLPIAQFQEQLLSEAWRSGG